jgi:hypothetical protein
LRRLGVCGGGGDGDHQLAQRLCARTARNTNICVLFASFFICSQCDAHIAVVCRPFDETDLEAIGDRIKHMNIGSNPVFFLFLFLFLRSHIVFVSVSGCGASTCTETQNGSASENRVRAIRVSSNTPLCVATSKLAHP